MKSKDKDYYLNIEKIMILVLIIFFLFVLEKCFDCDLDHNNKTDLILLDP